MARLSCSLACNKTHRENHPPDPEPEVRRDPTPTSLDVASVSNTDQNNPFRALDSSDHLRQLFQKYPNLQTQLQQIYAATQPPSDLDPAAKGIPASLLKGLPQKETWNHDKGIQSGKEALRKAQRAGGEDGAAIREYSELILHLMNQGDPRNDATILVQQQVAQEDSKLIERLMASEKR